MCIFLGLVTLLQDCYEFKLASNLFPFIAIWHQIGPTFFRIVIFLFLDYYFWKYYKNTNKNNVNSHFNYKIKYIYHQFGCR
jgi:hypothetical protein